ncbi:shikimate kinase [Dactylococcopsis salina]|uniref:Shikimate kinase n=1 Tax=Dactylococcopsis salina (strain PCC 8305) TaxID=13035 RepID=K9YTL9_DACS8|nr:shikimate kinase [Dactylococcopsis salina]AFZ49468.1 shikimate kinase [Dactylococcopsis salina PCC 8305]
MMMKTKTNLLQGLNIYLVGLMGVGKTAVGKEIAQQLNYRFFDTDDLIIRVEGKAITDIFAQKGETYFRELETKVLQELSVCTRSVIATGGGIIMKKENWSFLQQGLVVWLDAKTDLIMERLAEDNTRPLLKTENPKQTLDDLWWKRRSRYAQSDLQISIERSQSPSEIASEVLMQIPEVIKQASDQ